MAGGLGNSATFQVSGTPLVINGAGTHTLTYVSRAIVISGNGGSATIAFEGDGTELTVPSGQTVRIEAKVLKFTTTGSASVLVELTKIPSTSLDPEILEITRGDLVTTA